MLDSKSHTHTQHIVLLFRFKTTFWANKVLEQIYELLYIHRNKCMQYTHTYTRTHTRTHLQKCKSQLNKLKTYNIKLSIKCNFFNSH